MAAPTFPLRNDVQQLVDVQMDTLRKPALPTSSELDEYGSRSERIAMLCRKPDLIVRKALPLSIVNRGLNVHCFRRQAAVAGNFG